MYCSTNNHPLPEQIFLFLLIPLYTSLIWVHIVQRRNSRHQVNILCMYRRVHVCSMYYRYVYGTTKPGILVTHNRYIYMIYFPVIYLLTPEPLQDSQRTMKEVINQILETINISVSTFIMVTDCTSLFATSTIRTSPPVRVDYWVISTCNMYKKPPPPY